MALTEEETYKVERWLKTQTCECGRGGWFYIYAIL